MTETTQIEINLVGEIAKHCPRIRLSPTERVAELIKNIEILHFGHIKYIHVCSGQKRARYTFTCQQYADTTKTNSRQHTMVKYVRTSPTYYVQRTVDGDRPVRPLNNLLSPTRKPFREARLVAYARPQCLPWGKSLSSKAGGVSKHLLHGGRVLRS